jgi:threonine dehydrogenase-like Zn-dependent dehydrogenase
MKALVLESNGSLVIKEVPEPELPAGWALVKVDAAGICGSDLPRAFDGGAYHYPLIMGHEFSGTAVETPSGGAIPAGTRVAVIPLVPCRRCEACRSFSYAQCSDYDYLGSRRDGAFAEYVRAPVENLVPVPPDVDQHHAALTEPCAVALHGVSKLDVSPGTSAAVFGAGPIGNLAAQWLRYRGCTDITLIDIDGRKLELARTQGFKTISSSGQDPAWKYLADRDGIGADYAIEACGLPVTYRQALQCAERGGEVLFLGNIKGAFRLEESEFSDILRKELVIHGTWNSSFVPRGRDDWSVSLRAMGKGIYIDLLISHRVPLERGVRIFSSMRNRNGEFYNKVLLIPGMEP